VLFLCQNLLHPRLAGANQGKKHTSYVQEDVLVHPDFRAIVLANRPGFPFLGNDLFRETGDVFAPHVIENPDEDSELALLLRYAPSVPATTLRKLTAAFQVRFPPLPRPLPLQIDAADAPHALFLHARSCRISAI